MKGIRTFLGTGVILALCASSAPLAANTYTVTSIADSGAGTFRQAILDANGNPGADTITFAIVGSGVQTIKPVTNLPSVSEGAVIDGYTQSGASANTNGPGLGSNAVLKIEISGELLPQDNTSDCLKIGATGVTVKGLSLYGCFDDLIELSGADGAVIVGNFLGFAAAGVSYGGANDTGIAGLTSDNVIVGGTAPADRNVIVADRIMINTGDGWQIRGNIIGLNAAGTGRPLGHDATGRCISSGGTSQIGGTAAAARNVISGCDASAILAGAGDVIQGNFIGTDATGTHPINNKVGLQINEDNVIVGGSAAGAGNVIAAAKGGTGGITISGTADNAIVHGNWIGTDQTATIDLGNEPVGIVAGGHNHQIGGVNPGEGNVIAFNGGIGTYHAGIQVGGNTSSGITIRGNRIFANTVFGIDIIQQQVGPSPVDDLDADTGPNGVQNFPFVDSVDYGASTTVHGRLTSAASTVFDVDFYASPACVGRPPLYPQGPEFVGTTQVTTDASGHGTFDAVLDAVLAAGQPVTAIATDPAGSSSEFSNDILFVRSLGSGPAEGGLITQIYGHYFDPAAAVTIGGVPAAALTYVDSTHIAATIPALPPGSVNDIVVTNPGPGGASGTRPNGWVAEFLDNNLTFAPDVARLVANEITVGIGGGNYGFLDNIKRQQMAVFLLKGKHGICYVPPPCAGLFPDVPCPSAFANWIEAMAAEGITGGCGGGNFCPSSPVRRDQMAVFLLKAHRGADFVPPACVGHFPDVACPSPFADWIEELAAEGVTSGCGGGNYCPTANNTRGQMATFMVRTFSLQGP